MFGIKKSDIDMKSAIGNSKTEEEEEEDLVSVLCTLLPLMDLIAL